MTTRSTSPASTKTVSSDLKIQTLFSKCYVLSLMRTHFRNTRTRTSIRVVSVKDLCEAHGILARLLLKIVQKLHFNQSNPTAVGPLTKV